MSGIGVGEHVVVEHKLPDGLTIITDRKPVSFDLNSCYRMAFAVGCGFTAGIIAVLGLAAALVSLVHAVLHGWAA